MMQVVYQLFALLNMIAGVVAFLMGDKLSGCFGLLVSVLFSIWTLEEIIKERFHRD